jgi:hypothetical protein
METPGSLIDKLVIVNLKIFKAEDIKREPDASDKTIADATRLTNKLNKHRNDLIAEVDKLLGYDNPNAIKMYGNDRTI